MSFETELAKPQQDPIVLQEINTKLDQENWYNYEPGIWYVQLTMFIDAVTFGDFWENPDTGYNREIYNVGSYSANGEDYTEVSNLPDLRTQNESWYYDPDTTKIYVHHDNFDPPEVFTYKQIGIVLAFTNWHRDYINENGVKYSSRMIKAPVVKFEADDLFFQILQNDSTTIELLNGSENSLDDFAQRDLVGNVATTLLGYESIPYSEFRTMYTGKVSNVPRVQQNKVVVSIQSTRAFLKKKINTQYYSNTDATADYYYANLSDDDADKPVPLCFGECYNIPCVNLDEGQSPAPTNYTYKVCATDLPNGDHYDITSIDTVYVNGVVKSAISSDLVNGTFEIAGTDVKDGTSFLEVTADVKGYKESGTLIENPLRMIEIILEVYDDKEFISANYNLTEWNETKALVKDSSIFISEREEILDVIEKLIGSSRGYFIVQGDGKVTARLIDNDAESQGSIVQGEFFNLEEAEYDATEVLSDATVFYQKDYANGDFKRQYTDNADEEEVFIRFGISKGQPFETQLVNRADAVEYAQEVMDESKDIPARFPVETFMQNATLEIIKNVDLQVDRLDRTWYGTIKGRLVSHQVDLNTFRVNMRVKYLEDA